MSDEIKNRCIHIDWLEVYVLESNERYPCNAEYFERQGYSVRQRDYGTRVYEEMFEILDEDLNPVIEVRRNPKSGSSSFNGLCEQSSHIRVPNWMLYQKNPVEFLRDFLLKHDYIFKRIFRIDIAYDFEYFDTGDNPATFVKRYLKGVYRKINQCHRRVEGEDGWHDSDDNSLSWGSKSSMVYTKLYDKTMELRQSKNDKPWIKTAWLIHGLIDNPCSMTKHDSGGHLYKPRIWRIEFAMMSQADGWITVEFNQGQKPTKQTIPHKLEMFDAPDKLWQRFQDLAYNYFHFKVREKKRRYQGLTRYALDKVRSNNEDPWQRKDRCPDKVLFYWDKGHVFHRLSVAPAMSPKNIDDETLRRRLVHYRETHTDPKVRMACDEIIHNIERIGALRFRPMGDNKDARALQLALMKKIGGDERDAITIIEEIKALLDNDLF